MLSVIFELAINCIASHTYTKKHKITTIFVNIIHKSWEKLYIVLLSFNFNTIFNMFRVVVESQLPETSDLTPRDKNVNS